MDDQKILDELEKEFTQDPEFKGGLCRGCGDHVAMLPDCKICPPVNGRCSLCRACGEWRIRELAAGCVDLVAQDAAQHIFTVLSRTCSPCDLIFLAGMNAAALYASRQSVAHLGGEDYPSWRERFLNGS